MKKKKLLGNLLSSLLCYGALLLFSVLSSRYILVGYGSEVNGLISSVNQLFSYIALMEAGIGTATISALYTRLASGDGVQEVLAASKCSSRKSARWYLLCVAVLAFLWPLVLDTQIPYATICALILLQGIAGAIPYWYTTTAVSYLVATGQNYVNNRVHLVSTLVTCLLKLAICAVEGSILFLSVSLILVNAGKCLVYFLYLRKKCPEFSIKGTADTKVLAQRSSFFLHEITGVIFSGTDTILLSVFCSLRDASVYAVYALVFQSLRQIIGQGFTGTNYLLGNAYARSRESYPRSHDTFNLVYTGAVFAVFSTAYWLILPFVSLYTRQVGDAGYLDPWLPILFALIELLSACRIVDNQLIKLSLHARQTVSHSVAEAVINLTVSLALVRPLRIYGVLAGTVAALLYRTNDIILYANRKILRRSAVGEYLLYGVNFAAFGAVVLLRRQVEIRVDSFLRLVILAVPVCAGMFVLYFVLNGLLYRASQALGRCRGRKA